MQDDRRRPDDYALEIANAAMLLANTASIKMEAHAVEDKRMHEELNGVLREIQSDIKSMLLTMAEQRGARKIGYIIAGVIGSIFAFIANVVVKLWTH